jgi:hypothetical protein
LLVLGSRETVADPTVEEQRRVALPYLFTTSKCPILFCVSGSVDVFVLSCRLLQRLVWPSECTVCCLLACLTNLDTCSLRATTVTRVWVLRKGCGLVINVEPLCYELSFLMWKLHVGDITCMCIAFTCWLISIAQGCPLTMIVIASQ